MNKDIAALRRLFERGFEQMLAEQRRQAESIAEICGELRGLSAWLSSMDQRFKRNVRTNRGPYAKGTDN